MAPSATYICFSMMAPLVSAQDATTQNQEIVATDASGHTDGPGQKNCPDFSWDQFEEVKMHCDPNPGNWDQACDTACTDIVKKYKNLCTPEQQFWKDDEYANIHKFLNAYADICSDVCAGSWNSMKKATINACSQDFESDGCVSECNAAMNHAKNNQGNCSTKWYNADMKNTSETIDCGNSCIRQGVISTALCRHQTGRTDQCSEECLEKFDNFLEKCGSATSRQNISMELNETIHDVASTVARRCNDNCGKGLRLIEETCYSTNQDCRQCKDNVDKYFGQCEGDVKNYEHVPALQAALARIRESMVYAGDVCWHVDAQCARVRRDLFDDHGVHGVPCPFSMSERNANMAASQASKDQDENQQQDENNNMDENKPDDDKPSDATEDEPKPV